jgi:hypothetical protein
MIKRIIFAIIWFVVLYFGACMVTGGIVGGMAGAKDPQNAAAAGAKASLETVSALRIYFLIGAAGLSIAGAWAGILPGTAIQKGKSKRAA